MIKERAQSRKELSSERDHPLKVQNSLEPRLHTLIANDKGYSAKNMNMPRQFKPERAKSGRSSGSYLNNSKRATPQRSLGANKYASSASRTTMKKQKQISKPSVLEP